MKIYICILGIIIAIMGITTQVFSGGLAPEEENNIKNEVLTICKEPRPQVCTREYRPVCAQLEDGSFKTYSNGCTSCTDPIVVGYREGDCVSVDPDNPALQFKQ